MLASITKDFTIYAISEKAVSIEFGNDIDENINQRVHHLNQLIKSRPFLGLLNTIPAYTTLTLFFDPVSLLQNISLKGATCLEKIDYYLSQFDDKLENLTQKEGKIISIPVCYEDAFGLDLEELAQLHQLDQQKIIELHCEPIYKVYMIGFVPGFPYLGGLNPLLKSPRKLNPRKSIPAGSVGIAGMQTGIYPLETPGGWQIIGQTPLKLFDASREQPSLLKAGDSIKFEPITKSEFERIAKKQ